MKIAAPPRPVPNSTRSSRDRLVADRVEAGLEMIEANAPQARVREPVPV